MTKKKWFAANLFLFSRSLLCVFWQRSSRAVIRPLWMVSGSYVVHAIFGCLLDIIRARAMAFAFFVCCFAVVLLLFTAAQIQFKLNHQEFAWVFASLLRSAFFPARIEFDLMKDTRSQFKMIYGRKWERTYISISMEFGFWHSWAERRSIKTTAEKTTKKSQQLNLDITIDVMWKSPKKDLFAGNRVLLNAFRQARKMQSMLTC